MRVYCFTLASFLTRMKTEPFAFDKIGKNSCKRIMRSYPNGISRKETDIIFNKNLLGEHFFKRGSNVFMLDIEEQEKSVVLHCILSNDYNPSTFTNSYKHLKDKVELEHGTFWDMRFPDEKSK